MPLTPPVVAVASQASTERGVLLLTRQMPMAMAPVVDGLLGPSEARPPSLAPPPLVTFAGTRPIKRKPHNGKGGRTFLALLCLWRTPKGYQPRLVRVQGQSAASQPFVKHRHHTPRIVLTLKADEVSGPQSHGPHVRLPTHRLPCFHDRRQAGYRLGWAHPWPGRIRTCWTTNKVSWRHRILQFPLTHRAWSH